MYNHQADHSPIDRAALRDAHGERREQGDAARSERAGHGRERGESKDHPGNQRAAAPRRADRLIDDPRHGAVPGGDAEQVRDAREQHEQVHRKARVHLARRLADDERADEKRHDDGEDAEVDRPDGANDEDEDEPGDTDRVDGQGAAYLRSP